MNIYRISQVLLIAFMGFPIICGCSTHLPGMLRPGIEMGYLQQGADGSMTETAVAGPEQEGMSVKKVLSIIAPLAVMPYTVVPLAITVNSGVSLAGDMMSRPLKGTPEVPAEQKRQVELVSVDRVVDGD